MFLNHGCTSLVVQLLSSVLTGLRPHGLQHTRLHYVLHRFLEFAEAHVHWVSDAIQPSHPVTPYFSALNLSQHQVLFQESALHIRWPKCWSFSFSISLSNECSELICCRMDWLDFPAVQEILKSLFQHHSSKASILQCSAFFVVQLSHPYMTTEKTIALTRRTLVAK